MLWEWSESEWSGNKSWHSGVGVLEMDFRGLSRDGSGCPVSEWECSGMVRQLDLVILGWVLWEWIHVVVEDLGK